MYELVVGVLRPCDKGNGGFVYTSSGYRKFYGYVLDRYNAGSDTKYNGGQNHVIAKIDVSRRW